LPPSLLLLLLLLARRCLSQDPAQVQPSGCGAGGAGPSLWAAAECWQFPCWLLGSTGRGSS
jgi:hypothetical protein